MNILSIAVFVVLMLPQSVHAYDVNSIPMVFVKGGCYRMGDTFGEGWIDNPVHKVCLRDFYIGKYLVTQELWQEVMGRNPSYFKNCGSCPVEHVGWNGVKTFITKLNERTGKRYDIPTEAQWEYACRDGGKDMRYAGTNDPEELSGYAWFLSNSDSETHPVGQKRPNESGVYDMSGNVYEFVKDVYAVDAYTRLSEDDPVCEGPGIIRVLRGGSCNNGAQFLRCSHRQNAAHMPPNPRSNHIGFRLELQD
jgi:formylglycine-generating enzyme required for sulfatase activity